jgi:hypothetical protein
LNYSFIEYADVAKLEKGLLLVEYSTEERRLFRTLDKHMVHNKKPHQLNDGALK